jgi:hypothetical protein
MMQNSAKASVTPCNAHVYELYFLQLADILGSRWSDRLSCVIRKSGTSGRI